MIGKTLSHFRITGQLGSGGMGEVYRARGTKLDRDVALELLPAEMAADSARVVAALNHPNIVTIHSVGEADGIHFLTMEAIEGQSLDQLVPKEGLDLEKFFEIALPLADALSAAHDKGITHRDLKPANIMVTEEGRLKILDFGLAKILDSGSSDVHDSELVTQAQTREGMVMGTVPYMSPEQVQGKRIDHRTDIFSLGIILHEIASGRHPFPASSSAELISAILRDQPPSLTELRAGLPKGLSGIVERCLEKDTAERFQSARELRDELKAARENAAMVTSSPTAASPQDRSADDAMDSHAGALWIAVLPFSSTGDDPELTSFGQGLTEDIITGLSRFSYLSVVSRNSTVQYGGQAIDVRRVGKELGARYVMEGGIRKAGSTIRINVQLIDAHTGAHVWAETFDRNLDAAGIFDVQDAITDQVVATVADSFGVLVRAMATDLHGKPDKELSASDWMIRLFGFLQRITPDEHRELRDGLERAEDNEPRHADAWACLAQIYLDEQRFGFNVRPDPLKRALAAARHAVEIDPANQLGHQLLAQIHFFRRDLKAFAPAAERAMSLNPRDSNTIGILGLMIVHTGEFESGAKLTRRAMELNPHHAPWYHFGPLWEHFYKREYEEALEGVSRVNMPGLFWPYLAIASHLRPPGSTRRSRGRGSGSPQAQARFRGARPPEYRKLALRKRPARTSPGWDPEGWPRNSLARGVESAEHPF